MKNIISYAWSLSDKKSIKFFGQATQAGHKVIILFHWDKDYDIWDKTQTKAHFEGEVNRLKEIYGLVPENFEIVILTGDSLEWVADNIKVDLFLPVGKWFIREIEKYNSFKGVKVLAPYKNGWERRSKNWLTDNS